VRAYSSGILLRDTVKRQKVFDTARWKYTRHLMTEEDIHINERMVEEVLINELDNVLQITRESRLKLMNDIGQSLKCKACSETFNLKFLDNLRPELSNFTSYLIEHY
jgi:DNA polymerase II large subunit